MLFTYIQLNSIDQSSILYLHVNVFKEPAVTVISLKDIFSFLPDYFSMINAPPPCAVI